MSTSALTGVRLSSTVSAMPPPNRANLDSTGLLREMVLLMWQANTKLDAIVAALHRVAATVVSVPNLISFSVRRTLWQVNWMR